MSLQTRFLTNHQMAPSIDQDASDTNSCLSKPKTGLLDLPAELLDHILSHVITDSPIVVTLAPVTTSIPRLPVTIRRSKRYAVANYPRSLLLSSHALSAFTFLRTWRQKPLVLSLSAADALCFLKHILSERQREALRRVRFPRFLVSWTVPVGTDMWLVSGKEVEKVGWNDEDGGQEKDGTRLQALVRLLEKRTSCVC